MLREISTKGSNKSENFSFVFFFRKKRHKDNEKITIEVNMIGDANHFPLIYLRDFYLVSARQQE